MADLTGGERSRQVMHLLIQKADFQRQLPNRQASSLTVEINRMKQASKAADQVVSYAIEILAQEAHKHEQGNSSYFAPEIQEHFHALSNIIDRHVDHGPQHVDKRRALLERAEPFARFSPHHSGNDYTDDNEEIADTLNETEIKRRLPKLLLDRELGLRRTMPTNYDGGVHRNFKPEKARELTDSFGHLQQTLRDHVSKGYAIIVEQHFDRPARGTTDEINAPKLIIKRIDGDLAARGTDPTLERFEKQYREQEEKDRRAALEPDPFSDDSSPSPSTIRRVGIKRERDDLSEPETDSTNDRQSGRRLRRKIELPKRNDTVDPQPTHALKHRSAPRDITSGLEAGLPSNNSDTHEHRESSVEDARRTVQLASQERSRARNAGRSL